MTQRKRRKRRKKKKVGEVEGDSVSDEGRFGFAAGRRKTFRGEMQKTHMEEVSWSLLFSFFFL